MNVLVSASAHFVATENGELWSGNGSLGYATWARYLDVFDEVKLIVRAASHAVAPPGWNRATGAGVVGVPVPDFRSLTQFASFYPALHKQIKQALAETRAVILRVPCPVGEIVWTALEKERPYGVEVVGDPYGTFSPGAVQHPLRAMFRWWFRRQLRRQCAGASASSYVTARELQGKYPSPVGVLSTHYSSVELPEVVFSKAPRSRVTSSKTVRVVTVGSLSRPYKATDVLIGAVAACVRGGLDVHLTIVGEGRYRARLERLVASAQLASRVRFTGQLTRPAAVRGELDRADLFILPSRHEGLPKAMIEAMARGIPCIGSNVGGIPELLSAEDLVPPGDADALAVKIREVASDGERLARMSSRNLEKAREYRSDLLRSRRVEFYRYLRAKTEAWLPDREAVEMISECSEGEVTS
jgi:glycosyltransferase involved in cell wall biosynthesis